MARSDTKRSPAAVVPLFENERFRSVRFDFAPGAETGWHTHGLDYVITTITPCNFLLEEPDGTSRTVKLGAGESYQNACGVEHNVINGGDAPMSFVELEIK
ncbi:cupin domain-containing protein [Ahrensia sp. R2A130]|uniref:cupin domain-containing protein n=1 Tax=Ahrensia sp. R2A130 TaxID=744979 RepID=UPI0001E0E8B2|nr:cupin domain-containing protein [Ahrensia sp. R2A130]EFL89147.1 cupin 2 protein [Ahrensia sp. R2A130]